MSDAAHHTPPAPLWVTVALLAAVALAWLWLGWAHDTGRLPLRLLHRLRGIARAEHGDKPVAVWPPEVRR